MGGVPEFKSGFEAQRFAQQHTPFRAALESLNGADYERRYGRDIANAADRSRVCARAGDVRGLHLATIALSVSMREHERADLKRCAA